MGTIIPMVQDVGVPASMAEKVNMLRDLAGEIGLESLSDMARRWGVSREAARQFMDAEDAPVPVFETPAGVKYWATPDVDAFRTRRLKRAGGRGGQNRGGSR